MTAVIWDAAPDSVLLRRWRILATSEIHLLTLLERNPDSDLDLRYEEVSATVRIIEAILRRRGHQPCGYCVTVAPERHHSSRCPDLLLERLGLTDG